MPKASEAPVEKKDAPAKKPRVSRKKKAPEIPDGFAGVRGNVKGGLK